MKVLSCEFNIDTACVELRLEDGTLIAIDCTAVKNGGSRQVGVFLIFFDENTKNLQLTH